MERSLTPGGSSQGIPAGDIQSNSVSMRSSLRGELFPNQAEICKSKGDRAADRARVSRTLTYLKKDCVS